MRRYTIVFLLIIVLICSGCEKVTELDEKSFVTAIGFDKGENYNLRFTFVFTSPSKSNASDGKDKDETIVVEAPGLYSAMEQINNFKSKTVELTHTQTLIFSEELAKEGIGEFIYSLVRSNHFRPNTYICIADNSSMEFLEKINPVQTYHLEKYFQLLFNKMSSGTKGDLYLYDSYFRLISDGGAGVLPYCAINENKIISEEASEMASEEPSESETIGGHFAQNTDDFAINTIAGDSITKSDNNAEIQGAAVLKNGEMLTTLGRLEATMLQMITTTMPKTYFTVTEPSTPSQIVTCYISQAESAKIKLICKDTPIIDIIIDLEGDFSEIGKDSKYIKEPKLFEEYFEAKVEESLKKFLNKTIRELNCDLCGFSDVAKKNFATTKAWKNYNWNEKFSKASFNVDVNLTMRTYGELSKEVMYT